MLSDKEQKKKFKEIASRNPEKYYPVEVLKSEGFHRKRCKVCGTYFWTTDIARDVCGDPSCSGGFKVVENNPCKNRLSFIGVWKKIVEILEPRGYKPIKRYPVVARWNPTVEFTIASIAAFQPYVITGEVEPPAKKLLIPQFCLRFGDIENVGITGSHCTGFVMIGQHVFVSPEEWNQAEYFKDIYDFLVEGVGLSKDEFVIHEDAWAGGGSYGPCLEFFSRGVELFNQVYTMFEQTPEGDRELKLKVLDMGLGQERVAWFSQGTPNIYEAAFPYVIRKLKERTGVKQDFELYKKFSEYSAYLNIDEVDDLEKAWKRVAEQLGVETEELKRKILPMTAIYSIAEHARALLFAIADGKLPSNVGGGYNLRAIFRRAVGFIDRFGWNVDMGEVCEWHAEELEELFPELKEHLDEVKKVLEVELKKYRNTKKKAGKIIKKFLKKGSITEEDFLMLYDSYGINPEMVIEEAAKLGIKLKKPDDFYNKVVSLHEQKEQIAATYREIALEIPEDLPETKIEYYDNYLKLETEARVLFIGETEIDGVRRWAVITDKTIAYPTSGGQLHDIGEINGIKFDNVLKYGAYIVHALVEKPDFGVGDTVKIRIDGDWRRQLAAHHTATHIINAAARMVLGSHINQASAKKTYDKAHLDITHYDTLTEEQIAAIERKANEIIAADIEVKSELMPRAEAEAKYGMRIYQGGAVPGRIIRIVEIPGVDVEACGGTHMHRTGEIGKVKIIKAQKIQDGIIRLTFTGGNAVDRLESEHEKILREAAALLKVEPDMLPDAIAELLEKKKKLAKILESGGSAEESLLKLGAGRKTEADTFTLIKKVSSLLNCNPESVISTLGKHLDEYNRLVSLVSGEKGKELKIDGEFPLVIRVTEDLKPKEIIAMSKAAVKTYPDRIVLFFNFTEKGVMISGFAPRDGKMDIPPLGRTLGEYIAGYGGKGGGRPDNFQGIITGKIPNDYNERIKFAEEFAGGFAEYLKSVKNGKK